MRTKWSVTSDYELYIKIKKLSELTRIPVSKLLDEEKLAGGYRSPQGRQLHLPPRIQGREVVTHRSYHP